MVVSRLFHGCFKCSMLFQCSMVVSSVSWLFHRCFTVVSRLFHVCFMFVSSVLWLFHGCFTVVSSVSWLFHGCFTVVSWLFYNHIQLRK